MAISMQLNVNYSNNKIKISMMEHEDKQSCGDCVNDWCKRFNLCIALLEAYDNFVEEIEVEGKKKLRLIRFKDAR